MLARPGGIGDRKPSTLLMRIRSLSGSNYDAMERALFLNQLPQAVRTALANSKAANNDELGVEADKVMEEFELSSGAFAAPAVSSVLPAAPRSEVTRPVEVDAAFKSQPSRRTTEGLCFPHRRYGNRAYNCRAPATCPMRYQVSPPPSSGNARAGR